jgi:hypothetical protein
LGGVLQEEMTVDDNVCRMINEEMRWII